MNQWIIEDGKRRRARYFICESCGLNFLGRLNSKRKFCSSLCSRKIKDEKRIDVNCACCGSIFSILKSRSRSKSGYYFCTRRCKDQSQRIGGIKEIMPPHYGTSKGQHLWKLLKSDAQSQCAGCQEPRKFLLVIHHKDGNRKNNLLENLEVVCANCHIIRHLKLVDDHWIFDSKALTPRELLIEFMGP